jgi:CRP-like cAMP-binding protein
MPVADDAGRARPGAQELRAIGLFGGLDDGILAQLFECLPVALVPAGDVVFREGDPGREMFVVLGGELEVLKRSTRGDTRLHGVGPREWFGEMSIIDVMPRPVTVRAVTDARLLRIRPTDLELLYRTSTKAYALFVMNVARQLSRRLRQAETALVEAGG